MGSLFDSIDKAAEALNSLGPSSLTHDNISNVLRVLGSIDISELLDEYAKELPGKPPDDYEMDAYRKVAHQKADQLNKKTALLLDALEDLKRTRNTLDLSALDPVIQSTQNIIRPIHHFTASLQD